MRLFVPLALLLIAAPLAARDGATRDSPTRDSLGVFGQWGAFRDPATPRCYAIAEAQPTTNRRDVQPFASIGSWPARGIRNQLNLRLSRRLAATPRVRLAVGGERFDLIAGGGDAWAPDARADAAIVAALRAASSMSVSATDAAGNRFTDRYSLDGAATAIDAAAVGCARR
ncbi:hypothetical protein GRI62_04105 [Erythrobacter arachoides]|uniref:Uncharacterized protein n=1 Tax=Aurantiacibacter arachoides TaxID=1850444 RepID=A0A845A002_9SPHN|nr:invasion associated locus B family protein [Aurantiacibacter arachoides]MXO92792.1 hypothetical protein [Aurantiacibacter arachoides]GGD54438.1 hypothetical protein GCM10011411_12980 [Aurantiacibacter arachoides]